MKQALLTTLFSILIFCHSPAQQIKWENTITGQSDDRLYSLVRTTDGGSILAGYSSSPLGFDKTDAGNGGQDFWIIKLDINGSIQWQNALGGNSGDVPYDIKQTNDGGYIAAGFSNSDTSGDVTGVGNGGQDFWAVKLDASGGLIWQSLIGGAEDDLVWRVVQTIDEGYILAGISKSDAGGDKSENNWDPNVANTYDYWIIKLDSAGATVWENTIGGTENDFLTSAIATPDGGCLIGGISESDLSGDKTENNVNSLADVWLVKLDASGNITWQKTIGGNWEDQLYDMKLDAAGNYLLAVFSGSGAGPVKAEPTINNSYDFWIFKIDPAGNIIWQNTIGGDYDDEPRSVALTADGGCVVGGTSFSNAYADKTEDSLGVEDYWVIKLDASGNIEWQNTIGGTCRDYLTAIDVANDGSVLAGGYSCTSANGDKSEASVGTWDYWVVKLQGESNLIKGNIYVDFNSNSTFDSGDQYLPWHKITENFTGAFCFSENNGNYSLAIGDTGNYDVSPEVVTYYNPAPSSHSAFFPSVPLIDSVNDFAVQAAGIFNDVCVSIAPLSVFRPARNSVYLISYENIGTTSINPEIVFYPDDNLTFVSAGVTPQLISTDSVVWNLPSLAPFQSGSLYVVVNTAIIPNGTLINSAVVINPVTGDADPSCNYSSWPAYSVGSYDPNDKLVNEDTLYISQLASPPYLDYIINFQNTGTDTAFLVKVYDYLPVELNESSIEIVAASHPMAVSYTDYQRQLVFTFDNILLPDSNINEPMSHGYVQYRIKPLTTLLAGDEIRNEAAIYFDYNTPVITNAAVTIITSVSGIDVADDHKIRLYPNPAHSVLNIDCNSSLLNSLLSVVDMSGRTIIQKNLKAKQIDISRLHNGIYYLIINKDGNIFSSMFVKQ